MVKFNGVSSGSAPSQPPKSESKTTMGASFIKSGAAAKQLHAEEEAKAEARAAEANKMWRWRINEDDFGKDFELTFLDGHLGEDGTLEPPMWLEHSIYLAGRWQNIPCIAKEEPCPICAQGDKQAALVAGFTVIDHTVYTIKKGPNQGKKVKDKRKLFIAKRQTLAILQKLATKNGGLAGLRVEVSRAGDKDPAVGNLFQIVGKEKMSTLKEQYGEEGVPADFGEEITYYDAAELKKLGVGGAAGGKVGGHGNSKELDKELGFG